MRNYLFLLLAITSCALSGCLTSKKAAESQAKPAKLPTVIVYAVDAIEPEKKAADELKTYLTKISGANYSLQAEDKPLDGAAAIYVGQTAFARKYGLDFAQFTEEEYILRTVGQSLIISGSQNNGAINGVYHFLSRELGCRFFTWDCEVIPRREDLPLPTLDLRRKPSFAGRHIYSQVWDFGYTPEGATKVWAYLSRNFGNWTSSAYDRQSLAKYATQCHNEFFWVQPQKYAVSNPEFFSNKGKFVNLSKERGCNQEGNLCWTTRQVWEITLAELRACIKKDRAELPKWQWPVTYQICQNDCPSYCCCANCEAVFKVEGSRAGPLLQYVNFVAEGIAVEYPDVRIMTLAYVDSEDAPKNIRPAANVIIQWCDLYTRSDCYRPLTSKFNVQQKARCDGWKKLGVKLAVWDYWNMGIPGPYFTPPRIETMVDAIAPDLRYFAASGVRALMIEAEFCQKNPQNFIELQYYLGYQLMADVSLDEETLINEYMDNVYGPAAPAMEEFLTLLRQSVKNEKAPLFYIVNPVRTYTDGAFLEKVYNLLKKARASVPPGSDYERRVLQEMITPLAVIIQNPQYNFLQRTGLKKADMLAEYRAARLSRVEQPWVSVERRKIDMAELDQDIAGMSLEIPAPEHLKGREKMLIFAWPQMASELESDPDSPAGKAMVARGVPGKEEAQHDLNKPFAGGLYPDSFGIYSESDKRSSQIIRTGVPQDEKYHWYKIDAFDLGPHSYLWLFYWISTVDLSTAYTNADGLPGYNIWETWVSVKYTGPAYVKGSTQKNGVFVDCVILVKPEESKK